jgi:hypothetical protein
MAKQHLMIRRHSNYAGRQYTHVSACGQAKRKIHSHRSSKPITCKACIKTMMSDKGIFADEALSIAAAHAAGRAIVNLYPP